MPPGFPKGQAAYTTAKVIVARAFAPAGTTWKYAAQAVRPRRVRARDARRRHRRRKRGHARREHDRLRGRAPRLPRQLQGAERPDSRRRPRRQRRRDRGRDRGRREGRHERDQPLDRRARGRAVARPRRARARRSRRRGRRPRVAAGNDFDEFGRGSVASPGTSDSAITVAAVTTRSAAAGRRWPGSQRRPDGALAAAEARRQRTGRLDPLVRPGRLGGDVGHLDGDAPDLRRRGAPPRAASRTGRWRRSRRR